MVDQLRPDGAGYKAPAPGLKTLAVFSYSVAMHPDRDEFYQVRATKIPRESGGLRTARLTVSPVTLGELGYNPAERPIGPENYHQTPQDQEFVLCTPEMLEGGSKGNLK